MARETIGYCACPICEKRAQVMQTARKGEHLYSRCDDCGLNQAAGDKLNLFYWDNTEWLGEPPKPPACIKRALDNRMLTENKPKPESEIKPDGTADFEPETETTTEEQPKKGKLAAALLVTAGIAAAGFAAFSA